MGLPRVLNFANAMNDDPLPQPEPEADCANTLESANHSERQPKTAVSVRARIAGGRETPRRYVEAEKLKSCQKSPAWL